MSGTRPQSSDTPVPKPPPPSLEFQPDPAAERRVTRARTLALVVTFALLVLAFIFVITYRVPAPRLTANLADTLAAPTPQFAVAPESTPAAAPAPSLVPKPATAITPADRVSQAVAAIDRAAAAASSRWERAEQLMGETTLDSAGAAQATNTLGRIITIVDSARQDIQSARAQADSVRALSRTLSGTAGYRISVVYVSADRYIASLEQDVDDHAQYYRTLSDAVRMLGSGDRAEFEIQQNVANSYQRRSEDRQRAIRRLADELHLSASELPTSTR